MNGLQSLQDSLAPIRSRNDQPSRLASQPSDERPVELRIALRKALFKMDHHPMEVICLATSSGNA